MRSRSGAVRSGRTSIRCRRTLKIAPGSFSVRVVSASRSASSKISGRARQAPSKNSQAFSGAASKWRSIAAINSGVWSAASLRAAKAVPSTASAGCAGKAGRTRSGNPRLSIETK
ncbi:MAG: hypothetical protein HY293_21855 [Planctomycetes bacterium]|nr:hypothetical protein [Planctomycetota bacterium]